MSFNSLILPSEFFVAIVVLPNASEVSSISLLILENNVLNVVPDSLAFIPLFAINPAATATSCTAKPKVPANGAEYLNVSPRSATLVLDLEAVWANTSQKTSVSFADNPNAVNASDTISLTKPKSEKLAVARFTIGVIPASILWVSQPAKDRYWSPSEAWVADHCVDSPISLALLVNACNSLPVVPLIACTLAMPCSKSIPALVAYPANANIGADKPISVLPAEFNFPPTTSNVPPKLSNFWLDSFKSFAILVVSKLAIAELVLLISLVNNSNCNSVSFTPFSAFFNWLLYVFNCFSVFAIAVVLSSWLFFSFSNSSVFLLILALTVSIWFL